LLTKTTTTNDNKKGTRPPPGDTRLVQIGVRTLTPEHRHQVDRYGVRVLEAHALPASTDHLAWKHIMRSNVPADSVVYVSFDLDVLDPAYAPGVSHLEPGGMTVRQAITALRAIPNDIIGFDVVEYNPDRDVNGVTAMVAAKIIKEMLGAVAEQQE
jgi:arginase family enzyme